VAINFVESSCIANKLGFIICQAKIRKNQENKNVNANLIKY